MSGLKKGSSDSESFTPAVVFSEICELPARYPHNLTTTKLSSEWLPHCSVDAFGAWRHCPLNWQQVLCFFFPTLAGEEREVVSICKRCVWITWMPDGLTKPYVNKDLKKFGYKCIQMFLSPQYLKGKLGDSCLVLYLASCYMSMYINSYIDIETDTQIGR